MTDKKKKIIKKTTSSVADTFKYMTTGLTPEEAREEKKKKEKMHKIFNITKLVKHRPNKNK
ncbi:hypothetical protein [Lactobacillus sp.]|uniref:hypothetical protein n=1 Tax=Lactobacillus sp. TaxID=1591 RepID=UPI00258E79CA|nr:hypothetical protein [Lactobacillus sp.]MCO6528961.1 hypothetical protein [Lactobacillus sp.]MCO6530560.1 hypothetical protein [Lactobacillus sp.]